MSTIFQTRSILPPDPHHPEVPSEKPGIGGFVNALAIDSVQASLNHTFDDLSFRPDPQFDLEKHFDNLTAGLDPAYWPQFGYAVSMDHAVDIRRRMSEQQFADRSLQASGRWAIAGKIGAGFLDPPQALAMLATAGAGGAFGAGGIAVKGERLQAAVRAGLVGAEINAATTAFESTQKPTITANDVMRSALMGFGMGAAGPATAGSGRAARFAMGGAMSAAPTLAYDFAGRVTGLSDTDARDMQAEALQNFVIGGAFTALHSTNAIREVASEAERAAVMRQREVMARDAAATELYEKVARSYYKDLQFRDIAEAARKIGKTPEQVMTPEGMSQFSDQLAALQHNRTITPEESSAAKPMDFGTTARNEPGPVVKPDVVGSPEQIASDIAEAEMSPQARAAKAVSDNKLNPEHVVGFDEGGQPLVKRGASSATTIPTARTPLKTALAMGRRVNAALLDGYNKIHPDRAVELPDGYVRDGDFYVKKGSPESGPAASGSRARVAGTDLPAKAIGAAAPSDPGKVPAGLRDTAGWKLHLAVDESNREAVSAALKEMGLRHKVGRQGDQTGKDITVYIGSKNNADRAAAEINAKIGDKLSAPNGDPLVDDASFGGKVMGRFDAAGDSTFHQYGRDGIPFTKDDMGLSAFDKASFNPDEAKARADKILAAKYGEFYSGKAIGSASPSDPGFLNMRVQDDPRPKKLPGDLIIQESSDALPTFGKVARLGVSNAGFAPDGPTMGNIRRAYNAVFYDPIAKRDGSMGGEAATWSYGERRGAHAQAERSERNAYVKHKDFAKANGQKPDGVREFNQKVTEYRRSRGKLWADDPGVKAHSDFLNGLYEKELARQQRHGVVNAENVKPDPWHTPRVWVPQLVDQLRNRAGHEGLAEGIAKRITGDVNPALRRVYAEAILRVQMDKHWGTDVAVGHLLEGDGQMLVDVIRQIDKNLTEKQARDMVFYQKPDAPEGTPQWLRRRISLDETTPMDLIDQRTGEAFQQPISSMLNNDATELARRYVDHSVGSSTLSELFHSFARGDEKVPTNIKEFLDNLRVRMTAEGVPAAEIDPHLDRIEHGLKRLGGQPVRKYTDVDHWLRALTNLQFIRTMSSVVSGIQNYQQVGEAMAQAGWSVAIKSVPEILNIRQMMLRTDGVHLDNTTLRELEGIGHGDSPMSHRPRMFAPDENLGEVSAARKAAYWSARAAQVSGKLSLQEWSSKHAAYAAGIVFKNTWAEMVGSGRPMGTGKNAKRLANLAMRPEMADRIAAMIREHAVTEKTASGLKIKSFDTSAWVNDPEAASAFNIAQGRFIERVSGEGNETDLPLWMSSSTANVMLQLRKFVAKQWSGKTLYAIDQARRGQYAAVATQLVTTSAWSGLLYMARVYVQSIGREDRQDYLEKMLADDKIWKAGIGRNDALSLLPWMVDVASIGTGAPEPIFAFARSSEMREAKGRFGQVLAPPAIAWAEGVYGATSALGGSLFYDDYTFSKDDLESVATGLAIPNVFNLSTITKKAIASEYDLPTKSRTQHRSQP